MPGIEQFICQILMIVTAVLGGTSDGACDTGPSLIEDVVQANQIGFISNEYVWVGRDNTVYALAEAPVRTADPGSTANVGTDPNTLQVEQSNDGLHIYMESGVDIGRTPPDPVNDNSAAVEVKVFHWPDGTTTSGLVTR